MLALRAASACMLLAASLAQASGEHSLYGVKLREAIQHPECALRKGVQPEQTDLFYLDRYATHRYTDPTCFQLVKGGAAEGGAGNSYVIVRLSGSSMAVRGQMDVFLEHERVRSIKMWTEGIQSQEEDFAALVQKFGRPSTVKRTNVHNGYGARFQAMHATWKLKGAVLSLNTNTGSIDRGLLELMTSEVAEEQRLHDLKNQSDSRL